MVAEQTLDMRLLKKSMIDGGEYEEPMNAEIHVNTVDNTAEKSTELIVKILTE